MYRVKNETDRAMLTRIDLVVCTLDNPMPPITKRPVIANYSTYSLHYEWGDHKFRLSSRRIAARLLDNDVVDDVVIHNTGLVVIVKNHRYFANRGSTAAGSGGRISSLSYMSAEQAPSSPRAPGGMKRARSSEYDTNSRPPKRARAFEQSIIPSVVQSHS